MTFHEEIANYEVRANISEDVNTFLWLWDKTGTTHARKVLQYFNFHHFGFNGNQKVLLKNEIIQLHKCSLFPEHEKYKFFVTARNPYTRFASLFKFSTTDSSIFNKEEFRKFVEFTIQALDRTMECSLFKDRLPDYYVRVENLYEDYCKIPFIVESELKKSGKLENLCKKVVNPARFDYYWKDFYDKNVADTIYYATQNYFDFFGYDKNSWKK